MVDWDFAYNEILKIEERKKSKYTKEAAAKLEEEKARIERELNSHKEQFLNDKLKFEEEQKRNMENI